MKVARKNNSAILAANASHHRMDSLTTMLAIIATVGAHMFPSFPFVDPVCGMLVAVFVVKCGADAIFGGITELKEPTEPKISRKEV
jgi:divalent metal cation (Fe/Co/Zn/Cd) transporter